ncbi:unnamed protein product [Boreogadus saida]
MPRGLQHLTATHPCPPFCFHFKFPGHLLECLLSFLPCLGDLCLLAFYKRTPTGLSSAVEDFLKWNSCDLCRSLSDLCRSLSDCGGERVERRDP